MSMQSFSYFHTELQKGEMGSEKVKLLKCSFFHIWNILTFEIATNFKISKKTWQKDCHVGADSPRFDLELLVSCNPIFDLTETHFITYTIAAVIQL